MNADIRLYQVSEGNDLYYALTCGDRLLLATGDYRKAVLRYARLKGIDPASVPGPTHETDDDLALAEELCDRA
jgi:hypothetical protein